jgi:uracil-DNA glycosylase
MVGLMELEDINIGIKNCDSCYLSNNKGREIPKFTEHAKYILLLEQPLRDRPEYLDTFWELFKKCGLSREEFVVLHTVQCHTQRSLKKGRQSVMPSVAHREACKVWFHNYIKTLKPRKMLVMGNIPMEHVTGTFDGIVELNATVVKPKICGTVVPCVLSVSPNFLTYRGKGEGMIKDSLALFKHL